MTPTRYDPDRRPGGATIPAGDGEVVEVSLLLARDLWAELEGTAAAQGVTVAQLLRRLIRGTAAVTPPADPEPRGQP